MKIPKFNLYGENDPHIDEAIQPKLAFRSWDDLSDSEKQIALQELINKGWVNDDSTEVFDSIEHLNYHFLRICPGKALHSTPRTEKMYVFMKVALEDFQKIFLKESEPIVFRMLTKFAECWIDSSSYEAARNAIEQKERDGYVKHAFLRFDNLSNCLNHIFEQFAVNALLTRNGLIPRQDEKITKEIYMPTLKVLSGPIWKNVSQDLAEMFSDYHEKKYSESITKAHCAIQRFLQIKTGQEGKNSKGELKNLFNEAKKNGVIPINRFTGPIIDVFKSYFPSERASNSTAKPTIKDASATDALLMMNVVMVFLQHCLQAKKVVEGRS